jgi:hypothetical protein
MMEFWLSGSLSHELFFFHDGILAIRKPFSRTFSFFMMEFWLSGSLFLRTFLFSWWNFGYQEAFLTNFSFLWWNSGYQEAFLTNFSFFMMEFWLSEAFSHKLFFSHDGILEICDLGEDSLYIYIYIYISQRVFTQHPPH